MRRGSAVLLTILPLFSPVHGLPTYFGNDAAVAQGFVERAAIPEAALDSSSSSAVEDGLPNTSSPGPAAWLPKEKRQTNTATYGSPSSNTLDVDNSFDLPENPGSMGGPAHITTDYASYGSDHWLLPPRKREIEEREAKAEAEADPAITLDMDYVPPALEVSDLDLGPAPLAAGL